MTIPETTPEERAYLRKVQAHPQRNGLNDHMPGWREDARVRKALRDRGLVTVTEYRAAHAFGVDVIWCRLTRSGLSALTKRPALNWDGE